MSALLWRMLIAVIVVLLLFAAVPLFLEIIGFPLAANVWALLRIIIAGLAVLYVVAGPKPPLVT